VLFFDKNVAETTSKINEPMQKHTENATISYQYPCYIAIYISLCFEYSGGFMNKNSRVNKDFAEFLAHSGLL